MRSDHLQSNSLCFPNHTDAIVAATVAQNKVGRSTTKQQKCFTESFVRCEEKNDITKVNNM